ncbi:MAG: methylmalonyl-CoA mutase family protein, partial [Desulfohalobiaceae bacterium]
MYFAQELLDKCSSLRKKWEDQIRRLLNKKGERKQRFSTVSDKEINRLYTPEDIQDLDFERDIGFPGMYPFTRGVQATGYRGRLWTYRMFSGMGTARETNERWHMLLRNGQTG